MSSTPSNTAQKITSMLEILLRSDDFRRIAKDYIEPNTPSENVKTNESTSTASPQSPSQLPSQSPTYPNMCCNFESCKSIHPVNNSNSAILETLAKGNGYLESIDKNVKIVAEQSSIESEKAVKDNQIKGLSSTNNTNQIPFNDIYVSATVQDALNTFKGDQTFGLESHEEKLIKLFDGIRLAADMGVKIRETFDKCSNKHLEPIKPEVIRAQVVIGENINATGNIDKIKNDQVSGCIGPTGIYGQNVAVGHSVKPEEVILIHENCIKIPKGLYNVLGSWRGVIGQNLVKVRFECTSEKFALLAYISICIPPTPPFSTYSTVQEGKEVLSSKVTFCKSFGENVLSIEDVMGQSLTAWVTNTDIIGKLADGTAVNLKRK